MGTLSINTPKILYKYTQNPILRARATFAKCWEIRKKMSPSVPVIISSVLLVLG